MVLQMTLNEWNTIIVVKKYPDIALAIARKQISEFYNSLLVFLPST